MCQDDDHLIQSRESLFWPLSRSTDLSSNENFFSEKLHFPQLLHLNVAFSLTLISKNESQPKIQV